MSSLAIQHGAINLGQGFPNFDGLDFVKETAIQAIKDKKNNTHVDTEYPISTQPLLTVSLKTPNLQLTLKKKSHVTSGCTEAIAATILGLINPGDEVIVFSPFYDSYEATLSLTGWKIEWAIAPKHLIWGVKQTHSYLTFATSTPMQHAAVAALRAPDSYYEELRKDYQALRAPDSYYEELRKDYQTKKNIRLLGFRMMWRFVSI